MGPDRLAKLHFSEYRSLSIDDVIRAVGKMGTSEDPTLQDPKIVK